MFLPINARLEFASPMPHPRRATLKIVAGDAKQFTRFHLCRHSDNRHRHKKPGYTVGAARNSARMARKTGMAGNSATKNRSGKFHRPRIFLLHADAHGSHADAALHNFSGIAYLCGGRTHRSLNMGFFTELFVRPRPREQARYSAALALLNAMSNADRADIGIRPADFPRIAREMALR
ncbi:hypothetical protein [Mesorhizobium sp. ZC-5]|uniref:hypothetical protein n=1 Tax=Mesorhizobium sp. ZC-5 TaxID=2986066 RepID=UPI0021E8D247|nr:hypothetical protein [Mesorhizobium sp. ZC-5]MCV3241284.1 hypothetical protein [Mesorhizobium sp. ZC-5]